MKAEVRPELRWVALGAQFAANHYGFSNPPNFLRGLVGDLLDRAALELKRHMTPRGEQKAGADRLAVWAQG